MIVRTNIVTWFKASAITVFPFIFIKKDIPEREWQPLLRHEKTHYKQQKRWAIWGLGVGLLVWFALYLLVLPVGWNYFRYKWEKEAFMAEGVFMIHFREIIKGPPYYLYWM